MRARIIIETLILICGMSLIVSGNVFGEWSEYGEDETEINYSDSWNLGTPDNIPKTEVIIMGNDCGCPR
jgi:hypothetical protein